MAKKVLSLKSAQRGKVLDAYRGRGRRNNSLWLVYSVKTNRDWILTDDRQLVHWLYFLEVAPTVRVFDIETEDDQEQYSGCVDVVRVDGTTEKHIVVSKLSVQTEHGKTHVLEKTSVPNENVRVFTDVELKPVVTVALRWYKALAYAGVLRDEEHLPVRLALIPLLAELEIGTLAEVINATEEFNTALVIGMLVRLAIEGYIELDLTRHGVAYKTPWRLTGGKEHVES